MGWETFQDRECKGFLVNWVGVYAIIRSYLHSKSLWVNSKIVVEKNIVGPDLHNVEVDFNQARQDKDKETEVVMNSFYDTAVRSMTEAIKLLEVTIDETKLYDEQYTKQNKSASSVTKDNINKSIERGEIALETATVVRDLSAETLLVGATFMSGGAALAAISGGALLKGTAKYQDTGNVKAAVAEGVFTLGFGLLGYKIQPPPGASTMDKIALNVYMSFGQSAAEPIKSTFSGKSWISGEDVSNGLATGALKMGSAPLNETLKELTSEAGQKVIVESLKSDKKVKLLAIPIQVAFNYATDKGVGAIIAGAGKNKPPKDIPKQKQQPLLDTIPTSKEIVEKIAVRQVF